MRLRITLVSSSVSDRCVRANGRVFTLVPETSFETQEFVPQSHVTLGHLLCSGKTLKAPQASRYREVVLNYLVNYAVIDRF